MSVMFANPRLAGCNRTKSGLLVFNRGLGAATPASFSGLVFWGEADELATLWQDSARTSQVTSNGQSVGAWDDKSGNGNHHTQATAANQPTWTSPNEVTFDGANDVLLRASGVLTSSVQYTVFGVVRASSVGLTNRTPFMNGDGNGWALHLSATGKRGGLYRTVAVLEADAYTTATQLWTLRRNGSGTSQFWVNGTEKTLTNSTSTPATPTGKSSIGASDGGDQHRWSGGIRSLAAYNTSLSDADRAAVEAYFIAKHSL